MRAAAGLPKPFDTLNAIVDVDAARRAGWRPADLARAFLDGGASFLQLRAKSMGGAEFLDLALAIAAMAHPVGASLIINDRADIARLAGADGVHVGQDDLAPAAVRLVVGDAAIVGLSTHSTAQLDAAERQPVSYLAIGPVFGTSTKATGYDRVGLEMVSEAARRATAQRRPLVAIGGITLDNAASVIEAGASSVAVISDLLVGHDPAARVRAFRNALSARP